MNSMSSISCICLIYIYYLFVIYLFSWFDWNRPEKDHKLQITSFAEFLKLSNDKHNDTKLILVGGVRNEDDKQRVIELEELIKSLNLENNIIIEENLEFDKLIEYFKTSFVGR